MKFKGMLKEYMQSDDVYDLLALLFEGQEIIAMHFSNGDIEYMSSSAYKESGTAMTQSKGKQKTVERIYRISAEEIM